MDGRVSRFAEPTLAKLGEITESISLWPRLAVCNTEGDCLIWYLDSCERKRPALLSVVSPNKPDLRLVFEFVTTT